MSASDWFMIVDGENKSNNEEKTNEEVTTEETTNEGNTTMFNEDLEANEAEVEAEEEAMEAEENGTTKESGEKPKKRTRGPRDPNKAPVPNVSADVGKQIVQLWNDHSKDEIASKLDITPDQVTKFVATIRTTYKAKIKMLESEGDMSQASKLQAFLDTKLAPKPKGKVKSGPNIAEQIYDDLMSMM